MSRSEPRSVTATPHCVEIDSERDRASRTVIDLIFIVINNLHND
jgi:hypothetical protein